MMPDTPDLEALITERLNSATEHIAAADALATSPSTRGGAEQMARLLAAAAEAAIASALMLRQTRETVDDLAALLADTAALADDPPPYLADSFPPGAIDRAYDTRKENDAEEAS